MSDIAVRVEHLSKQYRLGASQPVYPTFREAIMDILKAPVRMVQGRSRPKTETFWALDDVSFEIKHGEAVGIIGRNGAGKSTLLKILSRITRPTRGRVDLYGRVGSLLEVGTGFHPELTGRENIYLNGAILGMSRTEILRKFDEIVEFSEIEKFLDTPVKFYSSGMYVRLAFAVAAHLEPEILIVDEVLAVGDAAFQKKCLGKMGDVAQEGRTVLFVSHNMRAIQSLCRSIIVLEEGRLKLSSEDVIGGIDLYLNKQKSRSFSNIEFQKFEDENIKLLDFKIVNAFGGAITDTISRSSQAFVQIDFKLKLENPGLNIGYLLFGGNGENYFATWMRDGYEADWPNLSKGINTLKVELPLSLINEGAYRIQLLVAIHNQKWIISPGDSITLFFESHGALIESPYWYQKRDGFCAPLLHWQKQ
jgi:lipopolysaccharide transport system ATP-binding protein